ncbi:MAG: hypothetical protein GDA38_10425 [Hormoscilla sp. SP12CHS1]|nr:hypothetical protein [Hormoscilla sp. SP12CHS1]
MRIVDNLFMSIAARTSDRRALGIGTRYLPFSILMLPMLYNRSETLTSKYEA